MPTNRVCDIEPFRYQSTPQIDAASGASSNQINEQALEDYLARLKEAVCADIDSILAECCNGGGGGGGAESFLELNDTPASYAGAGSQFVKVKASVDGLEFVAGGAATDVDGLTLDYSTSEQSTNRTWIGGATIYQKTISFGALPNATLKSVAHGIVGLSRVVKMVGVSYDNTSWIPLPFVHRTTVANQVQMSINATNVQIWTGANRTTFTDTYVTLWYLK